MVILIVLAVIVVVWALVEILQADPAQVRRLPRWAWAVLAIFPIAVPFGALAWFFLGRPKVSVGTPGRSAHPAAGLSLPRRQRYVARPAPDDDPEFLRKLNDEAEHRRMLRRLEEDLNSPKPTGEQGEKESD